MSKAFTNVRSLMGVLAKSMNLVNPDMEHHHEQTAYLAYQIAYMMGIRGEHLHYTISVALLHDIGAVVSPEQKKVEEIEAERRDVAKIGAAIIRDIEEFKKPPTSLKLFKTAISKTMSCSAIPLPLISHRQFMSPMLLPRWLKNIFPF